MSLMWSLPCSIAIFYLQSLYIDIANIFVIEMVTKYSMVYIHCFFFRALYCIFWDFPGGADSKASAYNMGDLGLIPGLALTMVIQHRFGSPSYGMVIQHRFGSPSYGN